MEDIFLLSCKVNKLYFLWFVIFNVSLFPFIFKTLNISFVESSVNLFFLIDLFLSLIPVYNPSFFFGFYLY